MVYRDGAAVFVKENKEARWTNTFANACDRSGGIS